MSNEPDLTPEQREKVAELERSLVEWSADQLLIGAPATDRFLGQVEGYAEGTLKRLGDNPDAVARYAWSCPHVEEAVCNCSHGTLPDPGYRDWVTALCPVHDDQVDLVECGYSIEPPTWHQPIRRLRLHFKGYPGRCPEHGDVLQHVVMVETRVKLREPVQQVYSTVRVK